ncbi:MULTISPECIES: histidine phosphatase family protein [Paenibacillus]|nr:histidine phosphatase family protein [Paenibacillus sp. IHBB 10380]
MEILFIRHAQAEHTMNPPLSLQMDNAGLTEHGIRQSRELREWLPLTQEDVLVISPTRRTIETAMIWSEGTGCERIIHPAVGPRMFPLLPASKAWLCDRPLPVNLIQERYGLEVVHSDCGEASWTKGINAVPEEEFHRAAESFLTWCATKSSARITILSHDGTITSYRKLLGEHEVSRQDFLGETGSYRMKVVRD